jgi:hypothetical protein
MYKKFTKSKKQSTENITDFSKSKHLFLLTKKRSPLSILFIEYDADPWFVFVKYFKNKTGEITDSNMIIKIDCETWLKHLIRLGYELKK